MKIAIGNQTTGNGQEIDSARSKTNCPPEEPKSQSTLKEQVKLSLEQFVSPVNRQKKNINFNTIKNNLVIEESCFTGAPKSHQKNIVSNPGPLYSPQNQPHRINFQTFVDSSNRKVDYRNIASMVEGKKHDYVHRQAPPQDNMNNMINRFMSFYDNNSNSSHLKMSA